MAEAKKKDLPKGMTTERKKADARNDKMTQEHRDRPAGKPLKG